MSPIKWALGLAFLCLALAGSALASTTELLYVLEGKNIVTYSGNNTTAVSNRVAALICVSFGLRISECLALKWSDINWLEGKLSVQRGIVRQPVGDFKTAYSQKQMSIDAAMLEQLKVWKQATQFPAPEDWVFASPLELGRQPWCYDQILREFGKAGIAVGIGKLGTHSMRHTYRSYRSWLDAVGTPIAVQQKLMRHADIRTTMNVYGDVVTNEMADAHSKVVGLALSRAQSN
jgi:integrase